MTRLKWRLISVRVEIVLILMQDRCAVCAERTIGSEIILARNPRYSYMTWVKWKLVLVQLELVSISTQGRFSVCAERTIGSEIILGTTDATPM